MQNRRMRASLPIPRLGVCSALGACLLVLTTVAVAQPAASASMAQHGQVQSAAYATGDAWIDHRLADIDRYAARYPEAFADELQRHAGVPRTYLEALLSQAGWRAGDAWFACFLGRATEATCRSVVRSRSRAGSEAPWSDIAAGFDATPGSPAYADVRLALADSYRRWDRPLQPDPALKRALREREQDRVAAAEAVR